MPTHTIAVIGAGFSGTLLALHLSRLCPPSVQIRLIERAQDFGPGAAYATDHPDHLLNVPAGRMSAFPDRPEHFLAWLRRQSANVLGGLVPEPGSFVPRRLYGRYLRDLLTESRRGLPPSRLDLVSGRVVAVTRTPTGLMLHLDQDRTLPATAAIIATGNNALAGLPAMDPELPRAGLYRHDPLTADALTGLTPDRPVLLVGTGLTMVDVALTLLGDGHTGPIHVLSRRGLLPRAHLATPAAAVPMPEPHDMPRRMQALFRAVRAEAHRVERAGGTWRVVIDALRPITQDIWQGWTQAEKGRFLRHVRPWWDVHRHRMAPAIAERIGAARASGQLRVHAGRIVGLVRHDDQAEVTWQKRGSASSTTLRVARVINCTGPASDVTCVADPLLRSLLAGGLARPDPLRLGLDVAATGALCAADGVESDRLFGIGPICRSALWEITAVPDIRLQCETLARHVAASIGRSEAEDWANADIAPRQGMSIAPRGVPA